MILKFLLFLLVVYISALALLYFFQDKMIYFPQPANPANVVRYAAHEIGLSRGEITLTGWFFDNGLDESQALIVYYGGNAEDVSLNFNDLQRFPNASFLFMNYRGYGNSTGKPSEKFLCDDALFVLDHILAAKKIDPVRVVLMGRSLGSGIAVHVAAKRKVGGVILVTPFDSLVAVARSHYPFFPVGLLLKHRFDSAGLAPGISTPALFLFAANDQIVPKRFANRLKNLWGGPTSTYVVKDVDHNTIETSPVYWEGIHTYLTRP